jgi:acetyl esterase/lipase
MSPRAIRLVILLFAIVAAGYAVFALSPWPTAMLIRLAFAQDASSRVAALARHVPAGIRAQRDIRYGGDDGALLDVFLPPAAPAAGRPVVVWIHGGGFVAGSKEDVAPYLQVLAGKGYAVVGVGYRRAPDATYPAPVLQVNEALGYLRREAGRLGLDAGRIVLAGDSAGAQIAAQLAAALTAPDYAATIGLRPAVAVDAIRGTALFCGVYDITALDLSGPFGGFLRYLVWAYFGTQDISGDRRLTEFAVPRYLGDAYPPSFVSAGNGDPLAAQSVMMADAIADRGVPVDRLFFPPGLDPALPHEYQFDLDRPEGRQALERLTAFLDGLKP